MRNLTLVASVIALMASANAYAVTAQSGIYVEGTGGYTVAAKPGTAQLEATKLVNKTYALGANLGYEHALNQNVMVGVEAGYLNLGTTNYKFPSSSPAAGGAGPGSYGKTQNWGYQVLATGTYLASNGLNGFVKAGAIRERSSMNYTAGNDDEGFSRTYYPESQTTKWLPAAVVGIGYMPSQNLNIALQYEHVFGTKWVNPIPNQTVVALNTYSKPMTQNIVSLGVSYKFAA